MQVVAIKDQHLCSSILSNSETLSNELQEPFEKQVYRKTAEVFYCTLSQAIVYCINPHY